MDEGLNEQKPAPEGVTNPPENPTPIDNAAQPAPPATKPDPLTGEGETSDLASLAAGIQKTKSAATPEGKKDAAEKKKRGRPPKNAPATTPQGAPNTPAPSFLPEDIDRAANETTDQSMIVTATVFGDSWYMPFNEKGEENPPQKHRRETLVAGWRTYYKRYGVKESHPVFALAVGYATYIGAGLRRRPVKRTIKKRFDKVKGFFKGIIMKIRGEV